MDATSIMHLLKGFCDHTQWKYAGFWKLDQHFPMTLTWENGYQKRDEVKESMWGDLSFKSPDELYSSSGENSDYSARLLLIEMSHRKYSLGEGVVGKIALARDHCWVSYEDILTSKFDTDLITECPDEWLLQFACGIKTIVLVPVLPQGVLQFGSFEAVAEDKEFVTNIKEKFYSTHYLEADITPLNLGTDCQDVSFSDLMHNLMGSLDESSSSVTKSILKSEVSTSPAALNSNGSRLNPTMLSFIQDDCFFSRENLLESLKRENENEIGSSSTEMPRHIGKVETKPNHMEEIWSWSHLLNNVGVFREMSNGLDSSSVINTTQKQLGGIETGHDAKNVNDFAFPSESEFRKALGSVSYGETGKFMSKCISVEETYSNSTLVINKKEHDHIKGLEFPKDVDLEYLLDAVVGNFCGAAADTSSISNSVRSLTTMPTEFTSSIQPENYSEESTLIVDSSDVKNDLMPAIMVKGKDEFSNHFTSSFDGNASLLIDKAQQEKANSHMQPIGGPKLSSSSKKRTRVGNNQKSRPRDRQLIMDRMKELRELVPEGGRCSIDNLLERTIKHMLYLRKITSQAEKLKRIANRAVPECKRQKVNASHPGRSCAFDFESEVSWPIVIEDLECSGHMLIEMICNEHGLFLEIAQVIRKLDVIILKGILENCSSNSWACFIVEVPRGFHRMDVLCPLLHLLQLRRNPVSCKS
ncbi:transcription factor EMB1444-like [Glycine soja]|uniref:Putative basic helix-loop-helix protein n=1 Tax=Glycine soja TaxID=3848 RepID=A0A0B2P4B6_GLYSO|nr:transcription factor EMB1444-like [Glycine soja]KHN04065.1 Putative basic helix-loop-helix protein [Glycine soja]RZB52640.1 Transcription factor bHLH155 isoform A [Glycine soja]RZB52641.1 Transcription factor bHLH155 isoform B [Glycine soja]RZB52642.1 Transcription factor bHLH155 isoform C [Glycine soja]RZB52643.1 Transcription factor bHLH155 isoform D [Glycine soja]